MRLACLGWGSLIWDTRQLRCKGAWLTDGPALPLEFTRISDDGCLTLVLTPDVEPVNVLYAEIDYASPQGARAALSARHGCQLAAIGVWSAETQASVGGVSETMAEWASLRGFDGVVWTALPPMFDGVEGVGPTSPHAAVDYLRQLPAHRQRLAEEYVRKAPAQIRTNYRQCIERELGWTLESLAA